MNYLNLESGIQGWNKKKADKIRIACTHSTVIHSTHISKFPAQVNQPHKPYVVAAHDH